MKIKQKLYLLGATLSLLVSFGFALLSVSPVQAYTCAYSGQGGNGMEGQYKLQMEGNGGNCYYMEPDQVDEQSKTQIYNNGQPTGQYKCINGTVMHDDGNCWTYKKTYTSYQPTFDDGSPISNDAFQDACKQQGSYYGSSYHYNAEHNACESGSVVHGGCSGLPDSWSDQGSILGPITGDSCRKVGDGTKTPGDVLGSDPTTNNVQQCTNAGATWNTGTKSCNWTQSTCPAKNNGQGYWDSSQNKCNAYSDYTNQADCQKVGGQWNQDPKDATHFECDKPGTGVGAGNNKTPQTIDSPPQDTQQYGQCGQAQTVLIGCASCKNAKGNSATTGVEIIGCMLKYGVSALSVLVGIAAVAGIVYEALQYARAQDNQSIVSDARQRILNIVIGLIVYIFIAVLINWLVPGGVIGG